MIDELALGFHIAAGAVGLVAGPVAIREAVRAAPLGWPGEAYHACVAVVCASAIALVALDPAQLWPFVPIAVGSYAFALVGRLGAQRRPRRWRRAYLRGNIGAYIALWTAVLVVSAGGLPLAWAMPSLIGIPLIHWLGHRTEGSEAAAFGAVGPVPEPDGQRSSS